MAVGTDGDVDLSRPALCVLLSLLLLRVNQTTSSDRLMEEMWPRGVPASGLDTLRAHISRLRRALRLAEPGAETTLVSLHGGYQLRAEPHSLDARRFEDLANEGHALLGRGAAARARDSLVAALSLHRGPPYAEIAELDATRAEIARLEALRRTAEEDLVEARLDLGDHPAAVADSERLVALEPLSERRVGQLMRSLYANGRQVEALRTYDAFRRSLNEDLGLDPGPQLRQLEQAILLQQPELLGAVGRRGRGRDSARRPRKATVNWPPPPPGQLARLRRGLFVGREDELGSLRAFVAEVAAGERRLFALEAEAGMGKTRLLAEIVVPADAAVLGLYARADDELVVPYQPVAQALDWLAAATPEGVLDELDGSTAGVLATLLPALGRRRPGATPLAAEPETERYRLFEAIRLLLEGAGRDFATLLIVDDAHAADRETVRLLRYLLGHNSSVGLGVVLSYRGELLQRDGPLHALIDDAERQGQLRRSHLRGLDRSAVEQLARDAAEAELPAETLTSIATSSGGNPLFISELLHHVTDGHLATGLPPRLTSTIEQRMERLSAPCRAVLDLAATAGHEFTLAVLVRASDLTEDDVLRALEEAFAANIVVELPGQVGQYTFAHPLVGEVRYAALSTTARARLHREVLRALEADPAPAISAGELARHAVRAVPLLEPAKAVALCRQAGEDALVVAGFDEARVHFEQALELVVAYDNDAAQRAELLLAIGTAQAVSTEDELASDVFRRAADAAREASRPDLLAAVALGLRSTYAGELYGFASVGSADTELVALLEEALAALPPDAEAQRSLLLSRLAQTRYWDAPVDLRLAWTNEAVAIAERLGDPRVLGIALVGRRYATWKAGDGEHRARNAERLVEFGRQAGAADLQMEGLRWLIFDQLEAGNAESLDSTVELHYRLAAELRRPVYRGYAELSLAMLALLRGNFAESRSVGQRAHVVLREAGMRLANSLYSAQVMVHNWDTGDLHSLAAELAAIADEVTDLAAVECGLAFISAETGDLDGARSLLADLSKDGFAAVGDDVSASAALAMLSVAVHRVGDADAAESLVRRLTPLAGTNIVVGPPAAACLGPADFYLGLLADCRGSLPEAVKHFDAAVRLADGMGARPMQARARSEFAAALSRGNTQQRRRAAALRAHAVDLATTLGMAALIS
ncbi:MAG TPA: BTAD domain-containing putative transcriptional regulator [Acidimicrobiales bacterium]|nr:BTAD domain-containing putative transcriptional regulator [Acidimicrobiales bacterium]